MSRHLGAGEKRRPSSSCAGRKSSRTRTRPCTRALNVVSPTALQAIRAV
jgi:hypothetical protein